MNPQMMKMMSGMGNMQGMENMDMSKMQPLKFEYFDMHARGCMIRMVLYYAKYLPWKDAPMSQEDFGKAKSSGYLKYGQLPCLTLMDGTTQVTQSNSIARLIGKRFKGMKGECLYPPNSCPEAMHAVDEMLELSTDFLGQHTGIMVPVLAAYKDKDTVGIPKFLDEQLPKMCETLTDRKNKRGFHCPYLVTECISLADIMMFSHFWRICSNPHAADKDLQQKCKDIVMGYPVVSAWYM